MRATRRIFSAAFALAVAVLLALPAPAAAKTKYEYIIDGYNLSVALPENYVAVFRTTSDVNPIFETYSMDGASIIEDMLKNSKYLYAWNSSATHYLELRLYNRNEENFSERTGEDILEYAEKWRPNLEASGGVMTGSEIYENSFGKYLKVYMEFDYGERQESGVFYLTVVDNLVIDMEFYSVEGKAGIDTEREYEEIVDSVKYPLTQTDGKQEDNAESGVPTVSELAGDNGAIEIKSSKSHGGIALAAASGGVLVFAAALAVAVGRRERK